LSRAFKHIVGINTRTGFVLRSAVVVCFALLLFTKNISAQVISNSGATINLTGGVVVQTDTVANQSGLITNNGIFNLNGDYRNAATTEGNGAINLGGSWLNTGTFNAGTSTVQFNGTSLQYITKAGGEDFYNLIINNTGLTAVNRIVLPQQITVSNTLTLSEGNIDPGANTVFLTNPNISGLNYTSTTGSRIIGKFQRGVNSLGTYLFPVGTLANYNPLNLDNNIVPTAGTILSEFVDNPPPGDLGLPITDLTDEDSVEVYKAYDDGYWNLVSTAFSIADFDVSIDGSGFIEEIESTTKVIKRTNGADWKLDGTHKIAEGTVGFRNNIPTDISPSSTQFGLALGRPKIWTHPKDTAVCDGFSASFTVYATGRKPLTYQWQVNTGSGWVNINNGGIYSGATSKTLQLSATNLAMDGYQYRVIVRDARNNPNTSNAATLTVNPIPVALATPQVDTLCDGGTTNVVITTSNSVTGTTFVLEVLYDGPITGATNILAGGNTIQHTLNNPTDIYDYVEYRIIPTGPNTTYCVGVADTVRIYVNPTPRAIATVFRDTICNDTRDRITLTSPSVFTTGATTFDYTSAVTGGITGNSADTDLPKGYPIEDLLHNPTSEFNAAPHVVTYTVTPKLTSYLGCANGPNVTAEVTVHPTPYTYFSYVDNVECYLEANGEATAVAFNTSPNIFTYQWNDPKNQNTAYADSLDVGTYIVTVTDNQNCITTDTVTIIQPDLLIATIDSSEDVTCVGFSDGWAYASAEGGNGGYHYLWSTLENDTTSFIKDVGGGVYPVLITDIRGCSASDTARIRENDGITASIEKLDVRCYGENNGWMHAEAPGATNYEWYITASSTLIGTNESVNNLAPGEYYVVISDSRGCSITKSVLVIEEPDSMIVSVTSDTISCEGEADAIAISTVSGGNTQFPYQYSWSNGSTATNLFNLSGGQYVLTVTDWLGCVAKDTSFIQEPPLFESFIAKTDVTCFGDDNGTIELTATGGNGDYSYDWGGGITSNILTDLLAGTYTVTIYDKLGCEIYDTATITEPDEMIATINKTDIQCFGFNNGTATIQVTGGNGGYLFDWSNGSTEDTITGLVQGTYYVDIVDIKGCDASDTVEISQPTEIQNNLQKTNITCFGFNNGQISVNPNGGIGPYTFLWSHDTLITTNSLTNLSPGPYTVYVIDSNECVMASDVELTQPDPLIASIQKTDITCFGDNDGSIAINMYGGTPAYNYNWSNGTTASSESWLGKGFYSINITDAQNCEVDTIIEVFEPDKMIIEPILKRSSCPDIQDGFIELNISGGIGYYSIFWSNGSTEEDLYNMRSGKYTVFIYDENSCELKADIILPSGKDFCVDIPSAFSPNNDGSNDKWSIDDMEELYPNADIEVFDRRGVRVFYSRGYSESEFWDGTYQGKDLPMDSYYYIIYLKNGLGRISGTVTILR